jgi:hypothetical protein
MTKPELFQVIAVDLEPHIVIEITNGCMISRTRPVREFYLDVLLDPSDPSLTLRQALEERGAKCTMMLKHRCVNDVKPTAFQRLVAWVTLWIWPTEWALAILHKHPDPSRWLWRDVPSRAIEAAFRHGYRAADQSGEIGLTSENAAWLAYKAETR